MRTCLVTGLFFAAFSSAADAHFSLTFPPARYSDLFGGVCGRDPETARDHVTTLHSGSTIVLTWLETISHPSYFRLSFDSDGQDDFPPHPVSYGAPENSPAILLNYIPPVGAPNAGSVVITLPNIECDNCTLQMLQVLSDHPPFGGVDDFHHQCADLILVDDTVFAGNFET